MNYKMSHIALQFGVLLLQIAKFDIFNNVYI